MRKMSGFTSTVAVLVAVAVAVALILMSGLPASAQLGIPDKYIPPCAVEFVNCTINYKLNMTEVKEDPDALFKCCTVFADLVKDDTQCVCETFVDPLKEAQYSSVTKRVFSVCNITVTPHELCKGDCNTGSRRGIKGLVTSVILFIWAMMF